MGVGIFSANMRVPSRKRLDGMKASVLRCEKEVAFAGFSALLEKVRT